MCTEDRGDYSKDKRTSDCVTVVKTATQLVEHNIMKEDGNLRDYVQHWEADHL